MIDHAPREHSSHSNAPQRSDLSFSNEISTATLVKLLVRKGLLAPSELVEEERQTRLNQNDSGGESPSTPDHHKRSRFKRWASKRKWSRRLTRRLFGWDYKRVRHNKSNDESYD
jgi:hypothetical protein